MRVGPTRECGRGPIGWTKFLVSLRSNWTDCRSKLTEKTESVNSQKEAYCDGEPKESICALLLGKDLYYYYYRIFYRDLYIHYKNIPRVINL